MLVKSLSMFLLASEPYLLAFSKLLVALSKALELVETEGTG